MSSACSGEQTSKLADSAAVTSPLGTWLSASADPVLLVVGSAVSFAPPSNGPRANEVVAATLKTLARAADSTGKLSLASFIKEPPREILPESLYSAIHESYGIAVHEDVWSSLNSESIRKNGSRPNAGHYAVALIALRYNATVLTTNFDPFIELAMSELGIDHQVTTGRRIWETDQWPSTQNGDVAIIKIHGDANDPSSLITKSPDLARARRIFRALTSTPDRALVIGYSGRDFDLFPWLAGQTAISSIAWVDLPQGFARPDHRSSFLGDRCFAVHGDIESLALRLLQEWAVEGDTKAELAVGCTTGAAQQHQSQLAQAALSAAADTVSALAPMPGAAVWALARTYADIGRHKWADEVLDIGPPSSTPISIEMDLLRAFTRASRDRYLDSMQASRAAIRSSTTSRDNRRRARGILQLRFSNQLYETLDLRMSSLRRIPNLQQRGGRQLLEKVQKLYHKAIVTGRFLQSTLALAPTGYRAIQEARTAPFGSTAPSYRLACDYLETLIRLHAFALRVLPILPSALTVAVWSWIDDQSHEIGYLNGAINVEKYVTRLRSRPLPANFVLGRLSVLEDALAQAIEQRDTAARIADGTDLDSDQLSTLDYHSEAAVLASRIAGASSIELQVDNLRATWGLRPIEPLDVERLLQGIQAREAISACRTLPDRSKLR